MACSLKSALGRVMPGSFNLETASWIRATICCLDEIIMSFQYTRTRSGRFFKPSVDSGKKQREGFISFEVCSRLKQVSFAAYRLSCGVNSGRAIQRICRDHLISVSVFHSRGLSTSFQPLPAHFSLECLCRLGCHVACCQSPTFLV